MFDASNGAIKNITDLRLLIWTKISGNVDWSTNFVKRLAENVHAEIIQDMHTMTFYFLKEGPITEDYLQSVYFDVSSAIEDTVEDMVRCGYMTDDEYNHILNMHYKKFYPIVLCMKCGEADVPPCPLECESNMQFYNALKNTYKIEIKL